MRRIIELSLMMGVLFVMTAHAQEKTPSAIQIHFEAPVPSAPDPAAPLTLVIERDPKNLPEKGDRLDILLRLPVGVKFLSEGWKSAELPPEEKEDSGGIWSLFERDVPLFGPSDEPLFRAGSALKVPISLTVAEEGANWVITARGRLIQGSGTHQAFGVIFATRQGEKTEFHAGPRFTRPDA